MTQRRHITLVAAGATVLAALPLATVFERWTWIVGVLIVVGAMTSVSVLLRSVRAPGWAPTIGMIGAYAGTLTWLFGKDAVAGLIPTPATFAGFNKLLSDAGVTIRQSGVPVVDQDGLLFLAALGIGAVLLAVDLAAVVARRPAVAGIPMVAVYLVPVGTHSDGVSFLAFVSTAAAFLWLLATDNVDRVRRFGRRFTGDGRDIDVWEPSPLAAAGRRLAVIGVVAAVVLPLGVPGMTTGLLNRFGTGIGDGPGGGSGSGASGNVNLFSYLHGTLVRDKAYDMVRFNTPDPNPFYLRFASADELTRDGFVNRPPAQGQPLGNIQPPPQINAPGVRYWQYQASVEIVNFNEKVLPVFQQLTKVERGLDGNWQWDRRANVVYSNRVTAKNRKYSFTYARAEYSPEALRAARDLPADDQIRSLYTRMPDVAEVRTRARELTDGKVSQYDKVRAIYDFFSPTNGFTYSTNTQPGNSGSAMIDFISEGGRTGYCEQYAAAMAWLVRAAGIPARVAFGFTKGNRNNGGTYTLSNFNLHAWTEVYFDGFGWVPFDATPASSIAGSVPTSWAPDPTRSDDPILAPDPDDVPTTGGAQGSASARPLDPQFGGNDPAAAGDASASGSARWPLYLVGGVLIGLFLVLLPALRRAAVRRRRLSGAGRAGRAGPVDDPAGGGAGPVRVAVGSTDGHRRARRDAHAAWDELIDTMIDYRLDIDPAETPRVTGGRLITEARLPEGPAGGVLVLSRAEERARYARDPLTDVDLGTPLRDVRAALRHGVSRRTRIMAALLPPSVLARWRVVSAARYAAVVAAVGRRRDTVTRSLSPRRMLRRRNA